MDPEAVIAGACVALLLILAFAPRLIKRDPPSLGALLLLAVLPMAGCGVRAVEGLPISSGTYAITWPGGPAVMVLDAVRPDGWAMCHPNGRAHDRQWCNLNTASVIMLIRR